MSAPDTNIEKQEARHKPALLGIKGAVVFGVLSMFLLAFLFSVPAVVSQFSTKRPA